MANEIKLEAFYIEISDKFKNRNKKNETSYYFGDVEGRDFLTDCVVKFVDENKKKFKTIDKLKRSFDIQSDKTKNLLDINSRIISGIVESGEFGYGSKIKDGKGKTKYEKPLNESNDLPFFFLFYIPKGMKQAVLILQKTGIHSIAEIFKKELIKFVREDFHNYKLDFSHVMSPELAKEILLNGDKQEIILTKYEKPKDIFDHLGDGIKEDSSEITKVKARLSFSANKSNLNFLNHKIKRFLNNGKTEVFAIPEYGFNENDEIKTTIKVKYNNGYKTIDLSENLNIKVAFEIEKDYEIERDIHHHPKFESINDIAIEILEELKSMR